ncbi:MAG: hypothetical protein Ct9H300mP1_29900 [Planctomycetaceae bacterium]|nr:MAG: hypothetical protein Ct9H300mP1_29900 [Planctomycetaceae bacterium]
MTRDVVQAMRDLVLKVGPSAADNRVVEQSRLATSSDRTNEPAKMFTEELPRMRTKRHSAYRLEILTTTTTESREPMPKGICRAEKDQCTLIRRIADQ